MTASSQVQFRSSAVGTLDRVVVYFDLFVP
jgi:hypothetical protein